MLVLLLFLGTTCNDEGGVSPSNKKCGDEVEITMEYNNFGPWDENVSMLSPSAHYEHTGEIDTVRYSYSLKASVENVCKHEHITVSFRILTNYGAEDFDIQGDVLYGIFHNYPVHFQREDIGGAFVFTSTVNFGIKGEGSDDDPGWYRPFITISFKKVGTDMEDSHYCFENAITSIVIDVQHYKFKPAK